MAKRMAILLLVATAILAPAASWAQDPEYVTVPVGGLYYRASTDDTFAYSGKVYQLWFPGANGRGWTVVSTLVAVAYQMGVFSHQLSLAGVSQQAVSSMPGDQVELPLTFCAYDGGCIPWFDGSLEVNSTAPPVRYMPPSP